MAKVPNVAVLDLPAGGYEDHLFLDLPFESPHCPVCLLVVREPHVLLCCGTRICQVCIEHTRENKQSCPSCNTEEYTNIFDRKQHRLLSKLKIRCTNVEKGCEWVGELDDQERHLTNECLYVTEMDNSKEQEEKHGDETSEVTYPLHQTRMEEQDMTTGVEIGVLEKEIELIKEQLEAHKKEIVQTVPNDLVMLLENATEVECAEVLQYLETFEQKYKAKQKEMLHEFKEGNEEMMKELKMLRERAERLQQQTEEESTEMRKLDEKLTRDHEKFQLQLQTTSLQNTRLILQLKQQLSQMKESSLERKYTLQLDLNKGMAQELSTLRFQQQRSTIEKSQKTSQLDDERSQEASDNDTKQRDEEMEPETTIQKIQRTADDRIQEKDKEITHLKEELKKGHEGDSTLFKAQNARELEILKSKVMEQEATIDELLQTADQRLVEMNRLKSEITHQHKQGDEEMKSKQELTFDVAIEQILPILHRETEETIKQRVKEALQKKTAEDKTLITSEEQRQLDRSLQAAVFSNNVGDVKILLGRYTNSNSEMLSRLLHRTAISGQTEILNLLIGHGVDINTKDLMNNTLLHLAAQFGKAEIVGILISHNEEVNGLNMFHMTPLHLASGKDKADVVNVLISHGGYIHTVDVYGETPLDKAKAPEVVEALKKQQLKDKALIEALSKNNHEDIEKSLKDGANPKLQNLDEALYAAVIISSVDVIEGLLKNGANFNLHSTLLHWASERGRNDIVTLLLTHGGDVDALGWNNNTALHTASDNGQSEIVSQLLLHGGNVNAKGHYQFTPLHLASSRGHKDVVNILILHGGDIYAQDSDERSPLDLVLQCREDRQEIIEILQAQQRKKEAVAIM